LYFTFGDGDIVYVYRYDIEKHEIEKLMEFKDTEMGSIALNGRYLYAETHNWYAPVNGMYIADYYFRHKVDYTVTRIDLFTETAVIIYSDLQTLDDFDKIGELRDWQFVGNRIIMPVFWEEKIWDIEPFPARWKILGVGSSINIATLDMRNFETTVKMEDEKIMLDFGGDLELYGGDIYFATGDECLSRVNIETGGREILNSNIREFSIDGDFLYYINWREGGQLYRVLLDYTREINFDTAVPVYAAEQGYTLSGWRVHNGYIYADIRTEFGDARTWEEGELPNAGRYRIKPDSQEEPYLFYRYE
jgi:hypothetical protein